MARPPDGVKLVLEAVCVMFKIKPKMVDNPAKVGQKMPDYWEPGKGMLGDPTRFLQSLLTYDKDNIEEATIKQIGKFMDNPEFQPERVAQVSKACKSMSIWVRAMHKYYYIARDVEPKRERLRAAQIEKQRADDQAAAASAELQAVESRLAQLQAKFDEANAEKQRLIKEADECKQRLARAEKLIGGLGGERVRWAETVKRLTQDFTNLIGDVLIASGVVAYGGAFTSAYRQALVKEWQMKCVEAKVPHSPAPTCSLLWVTCGDPSVGHQRSAL